MRHGWRALLLVVIIASASAAMRWNSARIGPPPEPSGDRLVEYRPLGWAELYLPAGHDTLPAILFSPGLGVGVDAYRTFLTDLASQGFVVVAIPYPPVKIEDNSDFVAALPKIAAGLSAAADRIARGGDSSLARIDTSRLAVIGHSFGGAAAATACTDSRFKAAVDLDGSLYGAVIHEGVRCPFLLIERSLSRADTIDKPIFYEERSQGRLHEDSLIAHSHSVTWETIDGLDHMSFTDPALAFRSRYWLKEAVGLQLNAARAQRITADLTIRFLQKTVVSPKR
jgi:dienelactone hydrolase